jgi:hypothetical protein
MESKYVQLTIPAAVIVFRRPIGYSTFEFGYGSTKIPTTEWFWPRQNTSDDEVGAVKLCKVASRMLYYLWGVHKVHEWQEELVDLFRLTPKVGPSIEKTQISAMPGEERRVDTKL